MSSWLKIQKGQKTFQTNLIAHCFIVDFEQIHCLKASFYLASEAK